MSGQTERLWCTACGTVTRDMNCDCNQYGQSPRVPNFVNYADAMQETAHEQSQQIDALVQAMTSARRLIGAINDTASAPVKESNINTAWHVLDDALASIKERA